MPDKFTDIAPLDYYYMHGYKIINPFCRILSGTPQYRYILEYKDLKSNGEKDLRVVLANSVTVKIMMAMKSALANDSKAMDLLDLDELTVNSVITGNGDKERNALVSAYAKEGVKLDVTGDSMLKTGNSLICNRFASLWNLLIETRKALLVASPATHSWVIRGDTAGIINYLGTEGALVPTSNPAPSVIWFGTVWRTNQFFSTSVGDQLASLAGKALVWLIRITPGSTQGRTGGIYSSEAEVLFPYDVSIRLDGAVCVTSVEQIAHLNLAALGQADALRVKLREVYEANTFPDGKAWFLVATEQ